MHWYKRNIGDYHKKAGRLTMLQHGAYTLLMDACYDREKFPTMKEATEWLWASTQEEISAVEFVLGRFFVEEAGVYVQPRIREELNSYAEKAEKNKRIAIERETNRRINRTKEHESCSTRTQGVNETPPNQEPRTKNQEPVTSNQEKDENNNSPSSAVANCPHDSIIEIYHKRLPRNPRVKIWTDKRKALLKQRWREDPKRQSLEWWDRFFGYVSESQFLTGMVDSGNRPFLADLEWIIKPSNFVKIIEGKYQ